jgi:hypothetical protein
VSARIARVWSHRSWGFNLRSYEMRPSLFSLSQPSCSWYLTQTSPCFLDRWILTLEHRKVTFFSLVKMHLQYSPYLLVLSLIVASVQGGKTSIYIDRVPAYSSLEQCAQSRVSAIVRAQASGCGDDMALTSFSCFCIDSSRYVAVAVQSRKS